LQHVVGCALTRDWAVLSQAIGKQSIDWLNTAIGQRHCQFGEEKTAATNHHVD
jgi:hypothetical protein